MRPITTDDNDDGWYDYDDLINSMEVDVLVEVSDNDYSGDTRALVRHNGVLGILTFGWGSCSGCDAIQAINGEPEPTRTREATDLRDDLWRGIHWESTPRAMIEYIENKDWDLDFHTDSLKPFLSQALDALRKMDPATHS